MENKARILGQNQRKKSTGSLMSYVPIVTEFH